jgi:hypothetical protein
MQTICTVRYSLILRKGSMRVGTYFSHKADMKGHVIDSWGKCSGKNKKRGLICGLVDFDCGDSCYGDVLAVNVRSGKLVIDRFAGCRGGDECTEKPKQVFSTAIGKAKVKARLARPVVTARVLISAGWVTPAGYGPLLPTSASSCYRR